MKEIRNRSTYIRSLSKKEFDDGCVKFNIPDPHRIESTSGEGVWGWIEPEEREKYSSSTCHEKMTAILLNVPTNYAEILFWGAEVTIKCHGECRPTLDPDWVRDVIWDGEEVEQE